MESEPFCKHCRRNTGKPHGPRLCGAQRWRCIACTRQWSTVNGQQVRHGAEPSDKQHA